MILGEPGLKVAPHFVAVVRSSVAACLLQYDFFDFDEVASGGCLSRLACYHFD